MRCYRSKRPIALINEQKREWFIGYLWNLEKEGVIEMNEGIICWNGDDESKQENWGADLIMNFGEYELLSGMLWVHMSIGIHRLVIIASYTPVNGDNRRNRNEIEKEKVCNILN